MRDRVLDGGESFFHPQDSGGRDLVRRRFSKIVEKHGFARRHGGHGDGERKIDRFELGGKRFAEPDVIYALAKDGPLVEASIEGNIGVEFLRSFRIVLDYRGERMGMVLLGKEQGGGASDN